MNGGEAFGGTGWVGSQQSVNKIRSYKFSPHGGPQVCHSKEKSWSLLYYSRDIDSHNDNET